jgi:hypothetical protein
MSLFSYQITAEGKTQLWDQNSLKWAMSNSDRSACHLKCPMLSKISFSKKLIGTILRKKPPPQGYPGQNRKVSVLFRDKASETATHMADLKPQKFSVDEERNLGSGELEKGLKTQDVSGKMFTLI